MAKQPVDEEFSQSRLGKLKGLIKSTKIVSILKAVRHFFFNTLGKKYNFIEAYLFDQFNGTDTWVEAEAFELDAAGSNVAHSTGYQAVNGRHFKRALNSIAYPNDSVLVDIGSGKGKVLLLASRARRLKQVVGIEFSGDLCQCAQQNVEVYADKHRTKVAVKVVHNDAAAYDFHGDENIFFMFNPFGEALMEQVVGNIFLSFEKKPRPIWLLYYNPVHRHVIENGTIFSHLKEIRAWGPGRNTAVYFAAPQ